MKKLILAVFLLAQMMGCANQDDRPITKDEFKQMLDQRAIPFPSNLDGENNSPNSWHSAHVRKLGIYYGDFTLANGTIIKLFFTGGTTPEIAPGTKGTIYVSVPSYNNDDADNTYYFQKFVPDGGGEQ